MNDLIEQIVGGLVRTGVAALGAWIAAGGVTLTGTQLDQLAGAVMILVAAGLSSMQKLWAARAARTGAVAAAVASAEQGVAITVTATPPGQPNIATRVSAAEAIAAPSVPLDVQPLPPPPGA